MAMMTRRVQVLMDEDRYARLEAAAASRGVSVATLVREAVDAAFPARDPTRAAAIDRFLDAPPIDVPERYEDLKREILTMWDRHVRDEAPGDGTGPASATAG